MCPLHVTDHVVLSRDLGIAVYVLSTKRLYILTVLGLEPAFDVPIVNVTVVAGQTAVLPCSIEFLGKYKVSY